MMVDKVCRDDVMNPSPVASFPMKVDKDDFKNYMTAIEQLELWLVYKTWCDINHL